jgi:uncharacterized repeat protein (TIGR03833 family)
MKESVSKPLSAAGKGFAGVLAMQSTNKDNPNPPPRSAIRPGIAVWIVEKKNYGTGKYTQGIVKDVLSSASRHPRGIKVRLEGGTIGRVQWLMEE